MVDLDKNTSPRKNQVHQLCHYMLLMGLCLMDAIDGRKVITVDIPGAFLQGDWPQDEHPGYTNGAKIIRRNSYTVVSSRQYTEHY